MKLPPPALLDDVVRIFGSDAEAQNKVLIPGKGWFISKSLPYYSFKNIVRRVRDAWYVLTNRAMAVQFAEDRFNKNHWN